MGGEGTDLNLQGIARGRADEQASVVDGPEVDDGLKTRQEELEAQEDPKEAVEVIEEEPEEGQEKQKPLPPEFDNIFSETHKHLEFLYVHLGDFFLFTPSGRVDETARTEIKAYIKDIEETHPHIVELARKMMRAADQLSGMVEAGAVPPSEIQKQGEAIASGLESRFVNIIAAAEDISGEEISGALGEEGLKDTKHTLFKIILNCLQFIEARQMAFIEAVITREEEEEERMDLYADADDTLDTATSSDDEEDEGPQTAKTTIQKQVRQDPVLVAGDEEEEEEEEGIEYDTGLDYSYGFIEPLQITVNFVTQNQDLRRDWLLMRDVGFVTGDVYMGKDGSTILRAYERVLPWVGPLRMHRFYRFNRMHRSNNPEYFKKIERPEGGFFPEAIFLDDSGVAMNAYKSGKEAWRAYQSSEHYIALKQEFGIED